jgi:hypothetical protein
MGLDCPALRPVLVARNNHLFSPSACPRPFPCTSPHIVKWGLRCENFCLRSVPSPYENTKRSRTRAELVLSSASLSRAREIVRERLVLLSDKLTNSAMLGQDRSARDKHVPSSAILPQASDNLAELGTRSPSSPSSAIATRACRLWKIVYVYPTPGALPFP